MKVSSTSCKHKFLHGCFLSTKWRVRGREPWDYCKQTLSTFISGNRLHFNLHVAKRKLISSNALCQYALHYLSSYQGINIW
jgi:hypothetical protein